MAASPLLARVAGASDATLVRLAGSRPARQRLVRALADRLATRDLGEARIGVTLTAPGRAWTYRLEVLPGRVRARAGTGPVDLGLEIGLADAVRVGLGELDPGAALLERRLEVTGDAVLAMRLADALSLS